METARLQIEIMYQETRNTATVKMAALMGAAVLLNLMAASPVIADRITVGELAESCDALLVTGDPRAGSLCRAFVQGYLMGAGKWANGIGSAPEEGEDDEESFTERAIETRVSPDLLEEVQEEPAPEFCLGETTGLTDVAQVVAAEFESGSEAAEVPDAMAVRRALAREFPCDG